MKNMDDQIIASIVASQGQSEVHSIQPIIGKGFVNQVYLVQTDSLPVIVRLNDETNALQVYKKEVWCMTQARAKKIPSPHVRGIGKTSGYAYMLQAFIQGENGEERSVEKKMIWKRLGEYAKKIHSIPVSGFGEQLADPAKGVFQEQKHDQFDGTWPSFLQYNVNSLHEQDELIRLGVYTLEEARLLKERFQQLLAQKYQFGLIHGDLSLKNTIVQDDGLVTLLDWGSALVHIVPHWELIQLLYVELYQPDKLDVDAFLEGYGMSKEAFTTMQEELYTLWLLQTIDKLRWAIDRQPQLIPDYVQRAKKVYSRFCSLTTDC